MKAKFLPPVLTTLTLILLTFASTGLALTVDQAVTPACVLEPPKEFSVTVKKDQNGLIAFTVVRTLSEQRYLVAHLRIRQQGKTLVESHTPSFAKQNDNAFYFSISPEHVADSSFEIGESAFVDGVPLPGTVNYRFRIRDFVPAALLEAPAEK
jgi:hypothetical protein